MNEADLPRIGIDLGGTKIEGVLLDASGGVERRVRRVTPRDDYRGTLDAIASMVAELEQGLGTPARVGVGTPGAVSPESFGSALVYFTGSRAHTLALRRLALAQGLRLNEYGLFRSRHRIAGDL